jgi:transcriptional regulator
MYTPSHFDETRLDVLHGLITSHPLGALVRHGPGGLAADHIPFEIAAATPDAPFGTLRAHVARANPLWREAAATDGAGDVMAIFQGPSAYISPSWYEEKPQSGKVVPTYNYAVVQAHGPLRAIEDPDWLLALLHRLTQRHEAKMAAPWSVADAPPEYVEKLLRAIVGIEIPLAKIEGKWKLSQNRPQVDQDTAAAALAADPATAALAALMLRPS